MLTRITCILALVLLAVTALAINPPTPIEGAAPFVFLENKGQILDLTGAPQPEILFMARSKSLNVYIAADGLHFQFERQTPQNDRSVEPRQDRLANADSIEVTTYRVDMHLLGANPQPEVITEGLNPYYENYYNIPHAPAGIVSVRSYERIVVRDIYPQIDWVIYGDQGALKYDFIVRPGGDAGQIKMQWQGAERMQLDTNGGIQVSTPLGEITDGAPASFVGPNAERVSSAFVLEGDVVRFQMGEYDLGEVLRIDPTLVWATYYGAIGLENAYGVSADSIGNTYMAGYSTSNTAIAMGGFQNTFAGQQDGFLVKFDPAGVRIWATYYGGASSDHAQAVALDDTANIYVAGNTTSSTGISFAGHQMARGGGVTYDAFLVKFTAAGLRVWGTYYGAINSDDGTGVTVDATGVYLSGTTLSTTAIAFNGAQNSFAGGNSDAFLAKFNAAGTRLWGTYCGGAAQDQSSHSCVDNAGNAFLVGSTYSTTGIALNGFQNVYAGAKDAFVVKYSSTGTKLWGTYYGGASSEDGNGVATDTSGNVYLVGSTRSTSGIAFNGFQNSIVSGLAAFLVKFDPSGTRLWGTYNWSDVYTPLSGDAVTCDRYGNPIIIGWENGNHAVVNGQPNPSWGISDDYFFKFSPTGIPISTQFIGGNQGESAWGIAADKFGNFFICGTTDSDTGIAYNGHQMIFPGGITFDGYLMKFLDTCNNTTQAPTAVCQNMTISITGTSVTNIGNLVAAGSSTLCGGYLDRIATPSSFNCSDIGLHTVSVQVYQPYTGLSSSCSATVMVIDGSPPIITCPPNKMDSTDSGLCSTIVNYAFPTATDNCISPTITRIAGLASGAAFPAGVTTNTFVASANGSTDTCSFTVTVADIQAPQIVCPPNFSGSTTIFSNCAYVAYYSPPIGTDNCQGAVTTQLMGLPSGDPFPVGVTANRFLVTDINGNTSSCTFTVTVVDAQPPTLACPPNMNSSGSPGLCGGIVTFNSPISTDNCPSAIITQNTGNPSGSLFLIGTTTNLYTVTDISGNTGTCSFTITVMDGVPPTITCPANIVQNSIAGTCFATIFFPQPTATDNCNSVTTTHLSGPNSGSSFPIGTTNEVYRATDAMGNSSTCAFTVTVNSNNHITQTINLCAGMTLSVGHNHYAVPGTFVDSLVAFAGGCDSIVTTHLTFEAPINTSITVTNPTISADLGGAVYRWLDCNNGMIGIPSAFGQTYAPTVNGSFAVIVIVGNCADTSVCANVIAVGLEQRHLAGLRGFPNPNDGNFTLDFGDFIAEGSVVVYDWNGK